MTQKKSNKNGQTRETLADVQREMSKPRLAESVRKAGEIAEEKETRVRQRHGSRE